MLVQEQEREQVLRLVQEQEQELKQMLAQAQQRVQELEQEQAPQLARVLRLVLVCCALMRVHRCSRARLRA